MKTIFSSCLLFAFAQNSNADLFGPIRQYFALSLSIVNASLSDGNIKKKILEHKKELIFITNIG